MTNSFGDELHRGSLFSLVRYRLWRGPNPKPRKRKYGSAVPRRLGNTDNGAPLPEFPPSSSFNVSQTQSRNQRESEAAHAKVKRALTVTSPRLLPTKYRQREMLKTAPSDVQLEAKVRSAQYRRNYKERCKKIVKTTKAKTASPKRKPPSPTTKPPSPTMKPLSPKTKLAPAPAGPKHTSASCTAATSSTAQPAHHYPPKMPRPRARGSPSPKSLTAIAADESSLDDPTDDESGYEVDEEDRRPLFSSTAVRATAEPGYILQHGQQLVVRRGVRYWY
ncbi:hypothetical protein C8F04DRAFT_1187721 [Mycena alexandri]|uniref:Uncharacterized protein n=1 Tax=Mycena alexandri TaxID=1745969 RepID=A0AAD6SN56_9AGAR|nr:hypothetical protein C8F04DRAFT_1187721 [Mycena alexandri]